jgi:hypothetical protein
MERPWKDLKVEQPQKEDYYRVKFEDGTEDHKPWRIRPKQNICGFMTMDNVTHWK